MLGISGKILDDFLPVEMLDRVFEAVGRFGWQYGWHSHREFEYTHWHHEIVGGGRNNTADLEASLRQDSRRNHQEIAVVWQFLKDKLYPNASLLRCYANQHTYGVEGYPHTDSERPGEITILVYMNKVWKPEWGGETVLFHDGEIVQSLLPKYGRVFLFNSDQLHCARSVSRVCPAGRVTLIFKIKPSDISDTIARAKDYLLANGAARVKHSGRSLFDHLCGTHAMLVEQGHPPHICLAGLFHSVYGTNSFRQVLIPISERAVVRDIIGESAESLVFQFCTIDRPGCFVRGDRDLIAIEIANLREQQDEQIGRLEQLLVE
jgi:hypothetical protein